MIIGDLVGRQASLRPDRIALIDTTASGPQRLSYAAWAARINQTAHWLYGEMGVRKGDRVAVLALNSGDYLDLWLACGQLGAILQNLNWRLSPAELRGLFVDAEPVLLAYDDAFPEAVAHLRGLPFVRHWVALERAQRPGDSLFRQRDNFPTTPLPPDLPPPDWDDPWVICYTGGTTGLPKGALLTHRAMIFNGVNTVHSWGLTADDCAILNAPLFHTGGLNVFTLPLIMAGGCSILCRTFDADQVFDLTAGGEVTLFFGVPTMFSLMQTHPRWPEADFSRLKLVISGGAACPLPVFEKFWAKGVAFKTGYGLTEAGPNTFWLPDADVQRKPGFVGRPLLFVEVKVIRPDGRECAPNEPGELIIRGPHLCGGYWRNPAATAAAIHPTPADPHGRAWLHTGDLALYDEEGDYRIVGRLKEMYISGGENVYPAEVESVLYAHPAVAEAAVIGVLDEKWGEVGCAFVTLTAGQTADAAEILAFCRERLARYKLPKIIHFLDALPKTGANKIDKKALADRIAAP